MILVKTSVRLSPIHGLGLFAIEFIPKNRPVWAFDSAVDSVVSEKEFSSFSESRKAVVSHFGFKSARGDWIIRGDGAVFMNHSHDANLTGSFPDEEFRLSREPVLRAARDISPGEEITLSYL